MATGAVSDLQLGKFLQIAFSEGVRSQISEDFRDWEMIKRARSGAPNGREFRFLFQNSLGPAAVQYRNPNFSSAFPSAQQSSISEHSAVFKELEATIEIEYNLWKRAQLSVSKYGEPLAREIMSKTISLKRRLAADLYNDGLGVMGTVSSVVDTAGAGGSAAVSLSTSSSARGHIGFMEFGDLLIAKTPGAVDVAPTVTGTFYAWRVKSKSRATDTVILEAVSEAGTVLALTSSNLVATNVLYRVGQPTIPILTSLSTIGDFGSATENIPGLEALVADDGRLIHGITMSGASAGSVLDAGGAALDTSLIQQLMDQVKVSVGQSQYSWKMLVMAPEAQASLINARETDRRFNSVEDNKRGVRVFAFQHGDDALQCYTSEYALKKRVFALPESKSGDKVLEYHGTDFTPVKVQGGGEFHLKAAGGSSGGYERRIVSYMEGMGTIICNRPAAIGKLVNFVA